MALYVYVPWLLRFRQGTPLKVASSRLQQASPLFALLAVLVFVLLLAMLFPVFLLLFLVLLHFLAALLFVTVIVLVRFEYLIVRELGHRGKSVGLVFGDLDGFALALTLVIFPGIEKTMQPRHDLVDRWQSTRRTRFAARASLATRALFAPLTRFARQSGLSLWARFALRACLATRTWRSGAPAGWPRSSLSTDRSVRQFRPPMIAAPNPSRGLTRPAIVGGF
jgi:hypothetical protein